jgi:hypothetical protein
MAFLPSVRALPGLQNKLQRFAHASAALWSRAQDSRAGQALAQARSRITAEWALLLAVSVAPLVLRVTQLFSQRLQPGAADARGLVADLGIALLLASLLLLVRTLPLRFVRVSIAAALLALFCTLSYGNYEHIHALGTVASLTYVRFLSDKTFLTGSALQLGHPVLFGALVASSWLFGWLAQAPMRRAIAYAAYPVAAIVLLGAHVLWPESEDAAVWRQTHYFIESARWAGATEQLTPSRENIPGMFPASLDGKPRIALGNANKNVIIVVLEGVSGAYLDSMAAAQDYSGERPRLTSLDRFAKKNLAYVNFVNHQRQTNRGLYALTCGEVDKLVTSAPKMSEHSWGEGRMQCLPELLRKRGYETLFVQAAPLGFMSKDKFMPRAGFSRVHGLEWFNDAPVWSRWGVDDKTFLDKSAELIRDLRKKQKPHMLMLLTAGTHHPFTVPETFTSAYPKKSFSHAIAHLDYALRRFIRQLDQMKVRDDTLVLFTSDESFGLEDAHEIDSMMLAQAWGYLIASVPSGERGVVREPFMQMDIGLSVMDYLGLGAEAGRLGGRSVFRSYDEPRPLFFGNTYMRMTAGINEQHELFTCAEDFSMCRKQKLRPEALFSSDRKRMPSDPKGVAFVKRAAARSLTSGDDEAGPREWNLSNGKNIVPLAFNQKGRKGTLAIFGSQYLSVAPGMSIEIDLDVEVIGANVEVDLVQGLYGVLHDRMPNALDYKRTVEADQKSYGESTLGLRPRFVTEREQLQEKRMRRKSGEHLRLRYTYVTEEALERLDASLHAKFVREGEGALRIHRATMRIAPADLAKAKAGLAIYAE